MNDIRIISGKNIVPLLDTVLELMECRKGSSVYEEVVNLYQKFLPEVRRRIRPKAALAFGTVEDMQKDGKLKTGAQVLYVICTVGDSISRLSESYFSAGEHLKGMVIDAMADGCLFAFEEQILPQMKRMCQEEGWGVSRRLSAPEDVPFEIQKRAFEAVNASRSLGLEITSGYMYKPVKSMCQIFELTEDTDCFELEHDCSRCAKTDCSLRQDSIIKIKVQHGGTWHQITCKKGSNLMQALTEHKIFVPAICGGNGKCGKCKVRILSGNLPVTGDDKNCLSEEEQKQGIRLSCTAVVRENISIEVFDSKEEKFSILGSNTDKTLISTEESMAEREEVFGIAIDIGTTTLAFSLVGLNSRRIIDSYTSINRQRAFGGDVISRIQAANQGKKHQLRQCIQKDLYEGIQTLLIGKQIDSKKLKKIVIAGNTTMQHLLMGYSCETLGTYPFTPVSVKQETFSFNRVFDREDYKNAKVTLLPGISAFVGADITAGLYECGFDRKESLSLLVDLGTNGEMAIGNREKILVTSAAAGPAFEGGNIEWGTGSIPGAICGISLKDKKTEIHTIHDELPCGICGTGVIEITAELWKAGYVDENGKLSDEFINSGFPLAETKSGDQIVFTQKDIREIQMAKSAIRAGIETLLFQYGVNYEAVDTVYLAGGFGYFMDKKKAAEIGLIPAELEEKTIAMGNTSLHGAIRFLTTPGAEKVLPELAGKAKEISLALDEKFNDWYMEYMMFERSW